MTNFIQDLTEKENNRQKNTLNLIASENYPSPKTIALLGQLWSNKYGEGYPGKRYYAGNQYTDELEKSVQHKALQVFAPKDNSFDIYKEYGVNVQVLSGSPANSTVYLSVLEGGDTILSLNLANGGHLSHLHQTSNWNKFFKHVTYDIKENGQNNYMIDLEDFQSKIEQHKPKLVIIGFSSYSKRYDFGQMCRIAHQYGALVLADIAHINGLVAAGLHDSPFKEGLDGADFVSMTTHKTFRGPRGALLFAKNYLPEFYKPSTGVNSLIEIINKTIFPGTSGGPHFNQIAAVGQACMEILGEDSYPDGTDFITYSSKTLSDTKLLEQKLQDSGLQIISPTENHLCLVKLPDDKDSLQVQKNLENIGIICNRNVIPFDTKSAWKPSGLRLGMPALTSRGVKEKDVIKLAEIISQTIFQRETPEVLQSSVQEIIQSLNWWY